MLGVVIFLAIAFGFSYWCGTIAKDKGQGFAVGFALGFFLGILGLIILLVMPQAKGTSSPRRKVRRPGSTARMATRPISRLSSSSVSGPTSTATMPSVSGTVSRPVSRTKRLMTRPKFRR
jgi:hypothetical protein